MLCNDLEHTQRMYVMPVLNLQTSFKTKFQYNIQESNQFKKQW